MSRGSCRFFVTMSFQEAAWWYMSDLARGALGDEACFWPKLSVHRRNDKAGYVTLEVLP